MKAANDLTAAVALNTGCIPMGARILACSILQDGQLSIGFVLAYLPDNNVTPYATWKFSGTDTEASGFYFGHYHVLLEDAQQDYSARVRSMLWKD